MRNLINLIVAKMVLSLGILSMSTDSSHVMLEVMLSYDYGRHIHRAVFLETLQFIMDEEIIVTDLLNVNLNLIFQRVG